MRVTTRKFQRCRAFGHQWKPTTVSVTRDPHTGEKVYVQNMACSSCKTSKSIRINKGGFIKSNTYHYADSYQVKGRLTTEEKAEIRRAVVDG